MGRKRAAKKSAAPKASPPLPSPADQDQDQQQKRKVGRPRKNVQPVKENEASPSITNTRTPMIVLERLDSTSYKNPGQEPESVQQNAVEENPKSSVTQSNEIEVVAEKALAQLPDPTTSRVTRKMKKSMKNKDAYIPKKDPEIPTPTASNVEEENHDTEMEEIIETKEVKPVETSEPNSAQLQDPISVDPAPETTPILVKDLNSEKSAVHVVEEDTSEKPVPQDPLELDVKPLKLESIVSEEKLNDIKEKLACIDLEEDSKSERIEVEQIKETISEPVELKSQDTKENSGVPKDFDINIKQKESTYESSDSNVRRSRRLQSINLENPSLLRNLPPTLPQQAPSEPLKNSQHSSPAARKSDFQEVPQMICSPMKMNPVQPDRSESIERLSHFITIQENIYLSQRTVCKKNESMRCDCTISDEEIRKGELGCKTDCINRLLYIECSSKCHLGIYCDNKQFKKHKYAKCSVFRTEKKGFGVQADQEILPDQFIFEFVGEVLNNKEFEERAKLYLKEEIKHHYSMALGSNAFIDATRKGNISRFINHSCDPNAITQKWTVNGELRVGFFSIRYIKPGEEITLDYQFQRYGKEAQKCYCEAKNCRGWISEPTNEDEEEIDAEGGVTDFEEEKDQLKKPRGEKIKKKQKTKVKKSIIENGDADYEHEEASNSRKDKEPIRKKETRRYVRKIEKHQKISEDLDIDEEINKLLQTGLNNRAQTVALSRLVVRAKDFEARSNLLDILNNGVKACRQLFLDYNGLKLFYNYWMCEINMKNSTEETELKFCIKLIKVLDTLEIKNKSFVRDSKIMHVMEQWKNIEFEENGKFAKEEEEDKKQKQDESRKAGEILETGENVESSIGCNLKEILEETTDLSSAKHQNVLMDEITALKLIVKEKAIELYKKWDLLVEDFKIPKKQKLEEMKLHEKEADADLSYQANKQELDRKEGTYRFKSHKEKQHNVNSKNYYKKPVTSVFVPANDHHSKQQKGQSYEFEMSKKLQAEKEFSEMYKLHEENCAIFGLNPQTTPFSDVPVYMNSVTGQYFTNDNRMVPTPPNHANFQIKAPALSTNPDHYVLPKIDLPEHWKFSIDEKGRIFYYHVKIRKAQWEPPIQIAPLGGDSSDDGPFSDESTTDTVDSEEEELIETLKMLQKKRASKDFVKSTMNMSCIGNIGEEDELGEKIKSNMLANPAEQTPLRMSAASVNSLPDRRKKKKKSRRGLVKTKIIEPRTEQDKLHGMQQLKRYQETKEKLRRERKLRAMKNLPPPSLDEEDDEASVSLNDSTVEGPDSLINKKFSKSSVVELDMWKNQSSCRIDKIQKMKTPEPACLSEEKRRSSDFLQKDKSETLVQQPGPPTDLKEQKKKFRDAIKAEIANCLQPYCEETCVSGRITCNDHYRHLVNKLTYYVFIKEMKHCEDTSSILRSSDSVKYKTREYIKKYMGKFGAIYEKKDDELDYSKALSKL